MSKTQWYSNDVESVLRELDTSREGLSSKEAEARLEEYGFNEIVETGKKSPIMMFLEQFTDPMVIILLVAIVISVFTSMMPESHEEGGLIDALVITAIVIFNAIFGFIQEYRSEQALEALKDLAAPRARVKRDGLWVEIDSRYVVPGDVISLEAGNKVPADGRVIYAVGLAAAEAALTGESISVRTIDEPIYLESPVVGDMRNMVFQGTTIVSGKGQAIITSTGMKTYFGRIAEMVQEGEKDMTPLQLDLADLGKKLGILVIALCLIVLGAEVIRDVSDSFMEELLAAIALAVSAIPEGLPAVVTITLAIGVQRMVQNNAIVRRLPSVETLGATTVICSDKTGTLTKSEMTVRRIWLSGDIIEVTGVGYEPKGEFVVASDKGQGARGNLPSSLNPYSHEGLKLLLRTALLCNDAHLEQESEAWTIIGDPTEGALVVAAAKAGLDKRELEALYPRVAEVPFTSERKRMTTVHATPDGTKMVCAKGAPEIVLARCNRIWHDGHIAELSEAERSEILRANEEMAADALRVLGVAYKELPPDASDFGEDVVERDLVFLGLMAMIDPPRDEVRDALRLCEQAGVKVAMVTGDHKLTAVAIAKELGMLKEGNLTLTGPELDRLSDEEFDRIVEDVAVYARVSPEHKMRIVEALKKKGHIVAMTGDGVNDAPALKRADMGVAMGITGTEVTKEASDMVLADDNFATIVAAIEEGRSIYDNIKKYLSYLLSCNVGEILIMFVASLMGLPLPLVTLQILWVNLTTDGLPAIALGVDPPEPDIMLRPPRDPEESVFTLPVKLLIAVVSVLMTMGTVPVFASFVSREGLVKAQTMAFTMVTMFEMFNAFNCRSERHSIFEVGPFANRWLVLAVLSSILLQAAVIYIPFLQSIFGTAALSLADWLLITAISSSAFIVVEVGKWLVARLGMKRTAEMYIQGSKL